jgi:hypothetical protein
MVGRGIYLQGRLLLAEPMVRIHFSPAASQAQTRPDRFDPGLQTVATRLAQEFSDQYPVDQWRYLKNGVPIHSTQTGLIHYLDSEPTFQLLGRRRGLLKRGGVGIP